jgi:hypothetical protein
MSARTKKKAVRRSTPRKHPKPLKKKASRSSGRRGSPSSSRKSKRTKAAPRSKAKSKTKKKARSAKPSKRPAPRAARPRAKAQRTKQRPRTAARGDKTRKGAEREKARKLAEREKARKLAEREKARKLAERERERLQKQRERERREREREQQRAKKERDVAKARELARREAERKAARKAHEEQKAREKAAREAERQRLIAEKEAQREEARRFKEEERARKDAEREAYRKAKEAERERLRAEREAARRALEGKVARATRSAQRVALGRGATTRVYRPDAIPDQSGTTRRTAGDPPPPRIEIPPPPLPLPVPFPAPTPVAPPPAPVPPPTAENLEERFATIVERLGRATDEFRREYQESFDMSWIYHDSALEGVVYTFQELKTAVDPSITVVPDSSLQPVCEEIRRHKSAIDLVRELADKKRAPITVDVIKRIYLVLHPEEGDIKNVKYRKDIPQHRLYFHEYAAPDKIAYKVRQVVDWLNGPEPKKIKSPVRIAARAHYDLLRVFPFPQDSGKVARLFMNLLLLRVGYPPAIIHSTERQRYYEALKGTLPIIVSMVNESIVNALMSIEKRLEEHEQRLPGAPAPSA